jgi:hypothetical protein
MTLLLAGLSIAGSTFAKPGGGKGGGNAGGGNGGEDETVYSAEGASRRLHRLDKSQF